MMPMLVQMTLHDQNIYVAHSFNCLDLMNAGVLLTVPLALHDVDADGMT